MTRLSGFVADKRKLAGAYRAALAGVDGVRFIEEPANCTSNYWLNALSIEGADAAFRDRVLAALHQSNIMARPLWTLLHRLPMYSNCPRMALDCAAGLELSLVNLPSSPFLANSPNVGATKA